MKHSSAIVTQAKPSDQPLAYWNPSPLTQRRIDIFLNNKRAKWSLWLFALMLTLSLCSPIIANDKPLVIQYKQSFFFPVFNAYPETTFGGDFETTTDYTDPYIIALIEKNGWLIWPLIPYHYTTHIRNLTSPAPSSPSSSHWLGTDDQARDVLARTLYGLRVSLLFAIGLTFGSSLIGITIGAFQGYFGGTIDLIGQRFLELWSGLPTVYLLIIISSIITPNTAWLLFIMLLFSWTRLVDLVRAECLKVRNLDYIKAARALGVSHIKIIQRHLLPNAMVATIAYMPFILAGAISTLTALDFLGLGLPPGSASLGELVLQGKNNLHAPWLGLTAFVTLSSTLTLMVFIGEGARDAFDPRLKVST
ncbi:ABC transporter permease [Marinagarivorans algicola]|uniref:ABC transporter permease n=1 Tax=Marinagarivorans algicola TaxID=1513270 RepID=UPI0006B58E2C|nr:ABC transporter permease [Marinagarivorans algicola]